MRTRLWFWRRYESTAAPIIVGGCGRSGTTVLRVMLDTHADLCCGPESGLFSRFALPHEPPAYLKRLAKRFDFGMDELRELVDACHSHAEFIDRFMAEYARRCGKPRWAEKTPRNVRRLGYVLRHFPKARFVHVIRDGRDVTCSLRTHPRFKVVRGELAPLETNNPLDECVARWVNDVTAGLAHRGDPRYTELRYEDLVAHPEKTLRELMRSLELPWDARMLEYHEIDSPARDASRFPANSAAKRPLYPSSVGRWRRDLPAEDRPFVKLQAGALLRRLGYAEDDDW